MTTVVFDLTVILKDQMQFNRFLMQVLVCNKKVNKLEITSQLT